MVAWQRITGTDPITQFPYPNGAPLFAYNGGVQEGFGIYVIDQDHGIGPPSPYPPTDAEKFAGTIGVTIETETVRGVPMPVLHTNHYSHFKAGYATEEQSHFLLYRNIFAPGFADLQKACFDIWWRLPNQAPLLDASYKFRAIHDFKTTDDFRYIVQVIRADAADAAAFKVAEGKIGFICSADNKTNFSLTQVEFFRMKNYSIDVPLDYFKSTIFWDRASDYTDLNSGRFIFRVNDQTVFDVNPVSIAQYNIDHPLACTNQAVPSNCINRHKGIHNSPWQRLFMLANYFGGKAGSDTEFYVAKLDISDDATFSLAPI